MSAAGTPEAATPPLASWAVLPVAEAAVDLDELVPWKTLKASESQPNLRRWRPFDDLTGLRDAVFWLDVTDLRAAEHTSIRTRRCGVHSTPPPARSHLAWSGQAGRSRRSVNPRSMQRFTARRRLNCGGAWSVRLRLTCFAPPRSPVRVLPDREVLQ